MSAPRPTTDASPSDDKATDLIRWAAFTCVIVPVVLLWYGASLAGTAGTALGLAAVTAACRLLLRLSERGAARPLGEEHPPHGPHGGRRHRAGAGSHRGGRHTEGNTPVG